MAALPEPCPLIGGELRGASDGGTSPIENPATGEEAPHVVRSPTGKADYQWARVTLAQ
jgi:hypothetical protein